MPQYIPYPKEKDTPSRKSRKGSRQKTFITNKMIARKLRKEARLERKAAREAAEEQTGSEE